MSDEFLKIIGSAIAGTLISSVIAKAYIMKSLRDLETALSMCYKINEKLAEINVRLDLMDSMQEMLLEHDRKISAMGSTYVMRGRHSKDS